MRRERLAKNVYNWFGSLEKGFTFRAVRPNSAAHLREVTLPLDLNNPIWNGMVFISFILPSSDGPAALLFPAVE